MLPTVWRQLTTLGTNCWEESHPDVLDLVNVRGCGPRPFVAELFRRCRGRYRWLPLALIAAPSLALALASADRRPAAGADRCAGAYDTILKCK